MRCYFPERSYVKLYPSATNSELGFWKVASNQMAVYWQLGQADNGTALGSGLVSGAVQCAAGALVGDGAIPNDWAPIHEDKTHPGGIV